MESTIPIACVKPLIKFLSTYQKLSNYVSIQPLESSIILTCATLSKNCFASITLHPQFFDSYRQSDPIIAKVLLKPILNILRNNNNIDFVDVFKFSIIQDFIILDFSCKHGIQKTHELNYQQVESTSAIYSKSSPNKFSISPKIVSEWIGYFQSSLEQVSMTCKRFNIVIKSFTDDVNVRNLETELNVKGSDFDSYQVDDETNFVIRLKEFKIILQFAESLSRTVFAFFKGPGWFICLI